MKEYVNYDFYENEYKGSLNIDLFNFLIPKANFEIENACNRELEEVDITEEVKFVICEMVDFLNKNGKDKSKVVISKSLDGASESYQVGTYEQVEKEKTKILNKLPLDLIRFL